MTILGTVASGVAAPPAVSPDLHSKRSKENAK